MEYEVHYVNSERRLRGLPVSPALALRGPTSSVLAPKGQTLGVRQIRLSLVANTCLPLSKDCISRIPLDRSQFLRTAQGGNEGYQNLGNSTQIDSHRTPFQYRGNYLGRWLSTFGWSYSDEACSVIQIVLALATVASSFSENCPHGRAKSKMSSALRAIGTVRLSILRDPRAP